MPINTAAACARWLSCPPRSLPAGKTPRIETHRPPAFTGAQTIGTTSRTYRAMTADSECTSSICQPRHSQREGGSPSRSTGSRPIVGKDREDSLDDPGCLGGPGSLPPWRYHPLIGARWEWWPTQSSGEQTPEVSPHPVERRRQPQRPACRPRARLAGASWQIHSRQMTRRSECQRPRR